GSLEARNPGSRGAAQIVVRNHADEHDKQAQHNDAECLHDVVLASCSFKALATRREARRLLLQSEEVRYVICRDRSRDRDCAGGGTAGALSVEGNSKGKGHAGSSTPRWRKRTASRAPRRSSARPPRCAV